MNEKLGSQGDFYLPDTDFGESLVLSFLPLPTNTSFLSEVLSEFPEIRGTAEGLEHLHAKSFVGERQ